MYAADNSSWNLSYNAPRQLLWQRWQSQLGERFSPSATQQAFQHLQALDVRHWLFDLTGLPYISDEDQTWLSTWLLPLLTQLPLHKLAIVFGNNLYNQLVFEALLSTQPALGYCDIQFFTDAESAAEWLIDNAPLLTT